MVTLVSKEGEEVKRIDLVGELAVWLDKFD